MISIAGVELEMFERGRGAPILYLHGGGGIALDLPFIDLLGRDRRIIAPSHPGFGKSSLPDRLDVPDEFAMSQDKLDRLRFHDPAKNPVDLASMPEEELHILARNRETLALLTWEPYMHNPKLKHRLHRVSVPTLFLRGASDGIVSAEYLERYAALIPQARTETIAEAGHLPQVEQPTATAVEVLRFLQAAQAAETSGARS